MLRRLQNIYRRMWQEKAKGTAPELAAAAAHVAHPEDDQPMTPPAPRRIARRALCLSAVCFRGFLETFAEAERTKAHEALLRWLGQAEIEEELEKEEMEILQTPDAKLERQKMLNCTWRSEGVVVLLHALGRLGLPSHDQRCDPKDTCEAAGLWQHRERIEELAQTAALAAPDLPDRLAARMLAIHWRLRQFRWVSQERMDFAKFATGVQWAKFDLNGVGLVGGDLAIQGKAIADADEAERENAMSIGAERHQAANWLCGWDATYSAVDTAT